MTEDCFYAIIKQIYWKGWNGSMNRMISYDKLSKKEKKAYDARKRVVWDFSPVTRKKENAKAYNRKKARRWEEDVPLTALFLMIYPAQNVMRRGPLDQPAQLQPPV